MRPSTPGRIGLAPMPPMAGGMMPPGTGLAPPPSARPGTRSGLPMRPPGTGVAPMMGLAMPIPTDYVPPSTGIRPPTAGMRPPTGAPGLAVPGTARLGTAGRVPRTPGGTVIAGVLGAGVQVADRPVTVHGVKSMDAPSQGPGRQVADKSYFLGLLRSKISDMQAEIGRMNTEGERMQKDAALYSALEKKDETLQKDVKELRERLADYNATVDNVRTQVELPEIRSRIAALKEQTARKRTELELLFTERSSKEKMVREVQAQVEELQRQAEAQISELDPALREEYFRLREERGRLEEEITRRRQQLEQLDAEATTMEMDLNSDPLRQRLVSLQHQLVERQQALRAMEEEAASKPIGGPEERQALLAQVKRDNAEIGEMEAKIRETEDAAARTRELIAQLDVDLQELQGEKSQKVTELLKRDEEMTQFIETYPAVRAGKLDELRTVQASVVSLLEGISKLLAQQQAMPSADQVADMRSAAAHKEQQLALASNTATMLQDELKARQEELAKMNTLDQRIAGEMQELQDRIKAYTEQLAVLADINGLRDRAESLRKQLLVDKQRLIRRKDALKQQNAGISSRVEKLKQQLADSESAVEIDGLEQKLRQYEQAVFQLEDFVVTKSRETNYLALREECKQLTSEIHATLQRAAQRAARGQ